MDKKKIKEYTDKGYLYVSAMFEIVGNPKEHVEKAIRLVIQSIKNQSDIIVVKEEYGQAEDAGSGLWGTYCDAEFLFKDINRLGWLAFNFVPANMEIKEPSKLTIKDKQLSDFINDLLTNLHIANQKQVQMNNMNKLMAKNVNALIRNAIILSLNEEPKTVSEIEKLAGIAGRQGEDQATEQGKKAPRVVEKILEAMIKEAESPNYKLKYKIVKKGNKYAKEKKN